LRLLIAAAALLLLALAVAIFAVVQPFTGAGARFAGPPAEPLRLSKLVQELVALGPRDDAAGQARAAVWLRASLEALGYAPTLQRYRSGKDDFANLIVEAGPQYPGRVIVGAHYDVHGPYPGADDNASGTAALLELARMLRGRGLPLRTELVFYSNEESGLLGSAVHARSLEPRSVRAMISLEMLGCYSEPQKFPFAALKFLYPSRGDYIVIVGRPQDFSLVRNLKRALLGSNAPVRSIDAPESIPGIGDSDHSSYWRAGMPAVMLTDTAWYRNPRYHTAGDTPETLDYQTMARVVDGVAAWISNIPR